jgi:streptomycin 6-kinase
VAEVAIPEHLAAFVADKGEPGRRWLDGLPALVTECRERWSVELEEPFGDPPGAAGWLAAGTLPDGTAVVLKLTWPHPEARTEADGLRWFDGRGAVRLLEADESGFALLLERVEPGDDLWTLGVDEGAAVTVDLLGRLWRPTAGAAGIGTLADTVDAWAERHPLIAERALGLAATQPDPVVLHGDLHPFNILRSSDRGWLVVDPKPLLGDPAYDLAQYLHNRVQGARATPDPQAELLRQIHGFADGLGLDPRRIAGWAAVKAVAWNFGTDAVVLFGAIDAALA